MEDTKRGLAPVKPKNASVRDRPPRRRELTVMILGSVGKVRSFKISPRIVLFYYLFFLFYIPISIYIINSWFDLRQVIIAQSEKIKDLEEEISKSKRFLYRSEQHIALLEDYISNFEEPQNRGGEPAKDKDLKEMAALQKVGQAVIEKDKEKGSMVGIDIRDMVIRKETSRMTVHFQVFNTKPDDDPISGYIHIVAMDKKADPSKEWIYPRGELRNGAPLNYRRGKPFLIKRFKPIRGEFNLKPGYQPPSYIKVLIYDRAGNLIFKEDFEVSNVS